MTPEDNKYTVKELLNQFVLPRLASMEERMSALERQLLTPEGVAEMVADGVRKSKSRVWSTRERILGAAIAVMTLLTLVINLLERF